MTGIGLVNDLTLQVSYGQHLRDPVRATTSKMDDVKHDPTIRMLKSFFSMCRMRNLCLPTYSNDLNEAHLDRPG